MSDTTCGRCGEPYNLRDWCEPTRHCDLCAHEVNETLRRRLASALRALRECNQPRDLTHAWNAAYSGLRADRKLRRGWD